MSRFIQSGKYKVAGDGASVIEVLDAQTGIVYMNTSNSVTPMLYDNGKPLHYNKDEIAQITEMLAAIGEDRYREICNESSISCDLANYGDVRYFRDRDWVIKDVYTKLCKSKKSKKETE